jgi:hypothetical protein
MEDITTIFPLEVRHGEYLLSLGLHHGELTAGKPVFLLLTVSKGDTGEIDYGRVESEARRIVVESQELDAPLELVLEPTQDGFMKKVTFPNPGPYKVICHLEHQSRSLKAQFILQVTAGNHRDSPVG